jgi:hypothetical protein
MDYNEMSISIISTGLGPLFCLIPSEIRNAITSLGELIVVDTWEKVCNLGKRAQQRCHQSGA